MLIRFVAASLPLIALPALAAEPTVTTGITNVGPAAFIFTIFLPIILLILWGRALEAELGWTNPDRWRR